MAVFRVERNTGYTVMSNHHLRKGAFTKGKRAVMQNLSLIQEKAVAGKKCTLCYRCANQCKRKAITILGKHVISQWSISDWEAFNEK